MLWDEDFKSPEQTFDTFENCRRKVLPIEKTEITNDWIRGCFPDNLETRKYIACVMRLSDLYDEVEERFEVIFQIQKTSFI